MGQEQSPRHALSQVAAFARRAWTRYWTSRAARATVGILSALDDCTLKDIGLDRSEIGSIVYGDCRQRRRGGRIICRATDAGERYGC